jgi:hypothetical protein
MLLAPTPTAAEMEAREVHWITKEMPPNKNAFQIVYNGRIVFQNWYDGNTGYEIVNSENEKQILKNSKIKSTKRIFLMNWISSIQLPALKQFLY